MFYAISGRDLLETIHGFESKNDRDEYIKGTIGLDGKKEWRKSVKRKDLIFRKGKPLFYKPTGYRGEYIFYRSNGD